MTIGYGTRLRAVVVAIMLGLATLQPAKAIWHPARATTVTREDRGRHPPPDPMIGLAAIVGGVALLVFLAWAATRIGDRG